MSCFETINAYALRSIGIGERLLPKSDITLCEQFVLIGSGMIWNVYFGVFAIALGFWFAVMLALGKASSRRVMRLPAKGFILLFRGTPLFIQFFCAYEVFVLLPKLGVELDFGVVQLTAETRWLTKAWMGALIVLFMNTSAYTAEIFYGALKAVPVGDVEAADAFGLSGWKKFRQVVWPTMLRLAWPAYTNEAIFLFHATTLVYFSGFPAWRQKGDALYYASYFAEKTFNPFVAYPIVAGYFILLTFVIIGIFRMIGNRLNRHLPRDRRPRHQFRMNLIR